MGVWFSAYFDGAAIGYQVLMSMQNPPEQSQHAHEIAIGCQIIGLLFVLSILYYNYSSQQRISNKLDKLESSIDKANFLAQNRIMEHD